MKTDNDKELPIELLCALQEAEVEFVQALDKQGIDPTFYPALRTAFWLGLRKGIQISHSFLTAK